MAWLQTVRHQLRGEGSVRRRLLQLVENLPLCLIVATAVALTSRVGPRHRVECVDPVDSARGEEPLWQGQPANVLDLDPSKPQFVTSFGGRDRDAQGRPDSRRSSAPPAAPYLETRLISKAASEDYFRKFYELAQSTRRVQWSVRSPSDVDAALTAYCEVWFSLATPPNSARRTRRRSCT